MGVTILGNAAKKNTIMDDYRNTLHFVFRCYSHSNVHLR